MATKSAISISEDIKKYTEELISIIITEIDGSKYKDEVDDTTSNGDNGL